MEFYFPEKKIQFLSEKERNNDDDQMSKNNSHVQKETKINRSPNDLKQNNAFNDFKKIDLKNGSKKMNHSLSGNFTNKPVESYLTKQDLTTKDTILSSSSHSIISNSSNSSHNKKQNHSINEETKLINSERFSQNSHQSKLYLEENQKSSCSFKNISKNEINSSYKNEKDLMNESMKSSEIKNLIDCDLETFAKFFAKKAQNSLLEKTSSLKETETPQREKSEISFAKRVSSSGLEKRNGNDRNCQKESEIFTANDNSEIYAINAVSHDFIQLVSPSNLSCDQFLVSGEISNQEKQFHKKSKFHIPKIYKDFESQVERNPILEVSDEPSSHRNQEKENSLNSNFHVQVMNHSLPDREASRVYNSTKTIGFESSKLGEKEYTSNLTKKIQKNEDAEELNHDSKSDLLTIGDLAQWKKQSGEWTKSNSIQQEKSSVDSELVGEIRKVVKECLQEFICEYERDKAEYMVPSKLICESINHKINEILTTQKNFENNSMSSYSEITSTIFPSTQYPASDSFSACFLPRNPKLSKQRNNPGSIKRSRSKAKMNNTGQALYTKQNNQNLSWSETSSNSSSYHQILNNLNDKSKESMQSERTERSHVGVPPLPISKGHGSIKRAQHGRNNSFCLKPEIQMIHTDRVVTDLEKQAEEEKFKRQIQTQRTQCHELSKENTTLFNEIPNFKPNTTGFSNLAYIRNYGNGSENRFSSFGNQHIF